MSYNELKRYFFNVLKHKTLDVSESDLIGISLYAKYEVVVYYKLNGFMIYTTCLVGTDINYYLETVDYIMFTNFEPYIILNRESNVRYEILYKVEDYHLVYDDGELIVYSLIPNIWKRDYTDDNIKIIEDL